MKEDRQQITGTRGASLKACRRADNGAQQWAYTYMSTLVFHFNGHGVVVANTMGLRSLRQV